MKKSGYSSMRISDILDKSAIEHKEKIAIESMTNSLTYSEFRSRSLEIAELIKRKCNPGTPIIISLPRSVLIFEVIFAVAYSNCFWVLLDTSNPLSRQKQIIDQFDDCFIVSDRLIPLVEKEEKYIIINLSDDKPVDSLDNYNVFPQEKDTDIMALIYTSGTTGIPKGVELTHVGMINHIKADCKQNQGRFTRVLNLYSPYTIGNISYFFATIAEGGTFFVVPQDIFYKPGQLKGLIERKIIRTLLCPPSVLEILYEYDIITENTIETVIMGGSSISAKLMNQLLRKRSNVLFVNAYGTTETYGGVFNGIILREDKEISIGNPFPSVEFYVVDQNGNKISEGKGELCICAPFLMNGYYKDKELTNSVIKFDETIGKYVYYSGDIVTIKCSKLYFEGRKDNQIKVFGNRVELEEIDRYAEKIVGVEKAISVFDKNKEQIVLFYSGYLTESEVNRQLSIVLPSYMRPYRYVHRDQLNSNGSDKIGRQTLLDSI